MMKVVLIDDDYLVRLNLKMLIDWEAYGLEIVGEAENGEEGLALIQEITPDFAIIDVQMPAMDGVTLTKKLEEMGISLYYIMLSNYDEFDYVRSAMKHGARDFLLKHKLNKESLTEQVENLIKTLSLESKDQQEDINLMDRKTEDFMMNLLVEAYSGKEEMRSYLDQHNMRMGLVNVIPVIMVIDHYPLNLQERGMDYVYKLRQNIRFLLKEILREWDKTMFMQVEDNKYLFMMSFEDYRSQSLMHQNMTQILEAIRSSILDYYNETVTFSVGRMVTMDQIKESYAEAYGRLGMGFYLGGGITIDEHNSSLLHRVAWIKVLTQELEQQLLQQGIARDRQSMKACIHEIFLQMENHHMDKTSALEVIMKLVGIIEKVAEGQQVPLVQLYPEGNSKAMIRILETSKSYCEWFLGLVDILCQEADRQVENYSDFIQKTILYIREHYQENISLSLVADHIGVNSSYLSKVFKDEVKVGFSHYVCKERIKHAKEYIQQGNNDFKEIARECGFNNYAYFFKVFKKQEGKTPKQYKNNLTHLKK